jgi:rubrerythrin
MANRLLPLTIAELCSHALQLERHAASCFGAYAQRLRELGDEPVARELEQLQAEERDEIRALEAAGGQPADLSPWEYAWQLTYLPDALEPEPRVVPMNACEALRLARTVKLSALGFYEDVAENAGKSMVRAFAADMAASRRGQLARIERLLVDDLRAANERLRSGTAAVSLPR